MKEISKLTAADFVSIDAEILLLVTDKFRFATILYAHKYSYPSGRLGDMKVDEG